MTPRVAIPHNSLDIVKKQAYHKKEYRKIDMHQHPGAHHELLISISSELISRYGFDVEYLRNDPIMFDDLQAVMDADDPIEPWAIAYHRTGNRMHLPAEIMFEGLPVHEGHVDDDYLHSIGVTALHAASSSSVAEIATPTLSITPVFVRPSRK